MPGLESTDFARLLILFWSSVLLEDRVSTFANVLVIVSLRSEYFFSKSLRVSPISTGDTNSEVSLLATSWLRRVRQPFSLQQYAIFGNDLERSENALNCSLILKFQEEQRTLVPCRRCIVYESQYSEILQRLVTPRH